MSHDKEIIPHKCANNWYKDVLIQYQKINKEQDSWVIDYTWYAKESDVNDGIAENIGDTIMSDTILISFCPFCGANLTKQRKNTW